MSRSRSSSSSFSQSSRGSSHRRERNRRRHSSVSSEDDKKSRRSRATAKVQPPPKSKCLGIFGLSANTTEDKIHDIFSKYGRIKRINLIFDTKTGRSRGFCFVYYKHLKDAINAKESCSGMEIDYRRIRVDYSITSRPHEPTPGCYKGQSTRSNGRRAEPSARSTRASSPPRSSRRRSPSYSPESYRR